MRKSTMARLTGLVAAAGTSAMLLGAATTGTGAYFSDRHDGSVNGTFGQVTIAVTNDGGGAPTFQWDDMLPGEWKTAALKVTNTGTANEDVYLAFDDANGEWSRINTLGTYGEAQVISQIRGGADYNNLNNKYPQGTAPYAGQKPNACGDAYPAISYLPAQNFVGTMAPGQSQIVQFRFRFGTCLGNQGEGNVLLNKQGTPAFASPLQFAVVATQEGVKPGDKHNRDSGSANGVIFTAPAAANQ